MSDKIIIYDASCPMCRWYTGAFIRHGLLAPGDRISFSDLSDHDLCRQLDLRRAPNEIPLVDRNGGRTLYGVEAMLHLLGRKLPWLPTLVQIRPLRWLAHQSYKYISYNRRTIAPSKKQFRGMDCTPDFNWFYRSLYLITSGTAAFCLLPLPLFLFGLLPVVALLLPALPEARMEWLGQVSTTLLIAGLLYFPLSLLPVSAWVASLVAAGVIVWQVAHRWSIFRYNSQPYRTA